MTDIRLMWLRKIHTKKTGFLIQDCLPEKYWYKNIWCCKMLSKFVIFLCHWFILITLVLIPCMNLKEIKMFDLLIKYGHSWTECFFPSYASKCTICLFLTMHVFAYKSHLLYCYYKRKLEIGNSRQPLKLNGHLILSN